MTIGHIKPLLAERAAAANATRSPGPGSGFAAVAAKVSESEPQDRIAAAQTPTTPTTPTAAPTDGLAAMRLALARMGAGSTGATATPPPATAKGAIVDAGSKDADAGAAKLPPLTGRDLHDMLKLQTGSFDPSLYERLGAHYNDYVNAYGAGGYYYDPTAVTLAAMSDSELEKLKTQYASPQAWLEKHGWYAHAVAAAPSSWDDLARARMA